MELRKNEIPIKQRGVDSPTPHAEFSAALLRLLNLLVWWSVPQGVPWGAGLGNMPSPHLQLDLHMAWSKMALQIGTGIW